MKDMKRKYTEEEIHVAKKYKVSVFIVIEEMQIKITIMRFNFIPFILAKTEDSDNTKYWLRLYSWQQEFL